VKNPQRIIPRAGISTCVIVCIIYFLTYLSVMSYLPWDPAEGGFVKLVDEGSNNAAYIMAIFCQKLVNRNFGIFFTFVVIYCIYGSCYSLMLGFAQVPYAAAKSGCFFEVFGHEHRKGFADFSLLFMGFSACVFCFVELKILIEGMLTTMILTMYMSNSLSLLYHRWTKPDCVRPYKMPLYPLPIIFQVMMFSFIFFTSDKWRFSGGPPLLELGIVFLFTGTIVFLIQSKNGGKWPFEEACVVRSRGVSV
jgi:amino acid transporter